GDVSALLAQHPALPSCHVSALPAGGTDQLAVGLPGDGGGLFRGAAGLWARLWARLLGLLTNQARQHEADHDVDQVADQDLAEADREVHVQDALENREG